MKGDKVSNILFNHFGTPNTRKGYLLVNGKIIIKLKRKKQIYYIEILELGSTGQFENDALKEVLEEIMKVD